MSFPKLISGVADVPMAKADGFSPVWPLPAVTRRRWTFGANRSGKQGPRHHAGVDLYAPKGSEVLAPEAGKLIASQRFLGPQAVALLMQGDSGNVILLGEVLPNSWGHLGLSIGDRVAAGQPVARVGVTPGGSSMLHYEMYTEGTRRNSRWFRGDPPPGNLLNPTSYLQMAKALDASQQDPAIEDDDDQSEHEHEDEDDDPGGQTTLEDECGCPPGTWAEFFPGGGCKCHRPTGQKIPGEQDASSVGPFIKLALLFGALTLLSDSDGR